MAVYRLNNRSFSRVWRRNKDYSDHEIRWLAKKRGLEFRENKTTIELVNRNNQVVAAFQEVPAQMEAAPVNEKTRLLAALKQ